MLKYENKNMLKENNIFSGSFDSGSITSWFLGCVVVMFVLIYIKPSLMAYSIFYFKIE